MTIMLERRPVLSKAELDRIVEIARATPHAVGVDADYWSAEQLSEYLEHRVVVSRIPPGELVSILRARGVAPFGSRCV